MANPYFQFKAFTVFHDRCAMKVTTDACLFGAWCAEGCRLDNVDGQKVLDIGTGTGLLSLMVAQKNKVCIDAVEIDKGAADQATRNVNDSPFKDTITVIQTAIQEWTPTNYDVIISNPPFYENELSSAQQQKNIAHHGDGLKLETLFSIISDKLSDSGYFYLLLPYKRKAAIEKLLQQAGFFLEKEVTVKPSVKHLPFRLLLKGRKLPTTCITETLCIYNEEKQYTHEFMTLLRDYYLYL